MIQRGSIIKGYHAYANSLHVRWRQIFEKLRRMKFFRIEISYDCVAIEGYPTRTKKLGNIRNIRICIGKKLTVSVTYENERISMKNSLPY